MRKIAIWILPIVLLLTSCQKASAFALVQPEATVDKIEIIWVYNWLEYDPDDTDTYEICYTILKEQHISFLEDLYDVPCYKYRNDPFQGFGQNTIRVTYLDGAFELIGARTVYYETADGEWKYPTYYFDTEAFGSLISAYKTGTSLYEGTD